MKLVGWAELRESRQHVFPGANPCAETQGDIYRRVTEGTEAQRKILATKERKGRREIRT